LNEKIIQTFYGRTDIPYFVVFSPISNLCNSLTNTLYETESSRGWWKNVTGTTEEGRRVIVVKTPTGNSITDSVISLNHKKTFLIHFGYCGGISPSVRIGELVAADESYFLNQNISYKTKFRTEILKTVNPFVVIGRNVTVESILREKDSLENVQTDTISVDQETTYVYRDSINPCISIMIASDLPLTRPFYEIGDEDRKKINERSKKASSLIISLIDEI